MEISDFKCSVHNLNFIKYCNNCDKNICSKCEEEHKNHQFIDFKGIKPNEVDLKNKLKNFESCIIRFKEYINNQVNKLEQLKQKIEEYYKVIDEHIKNYLNKKMSYESLQTLNKFYGFNIINYINELCNDNNIINLSEQLYDKLVEKLYENLNQTQIVKNNIPLKKITQLKNPNLKFNCVLFQYYSKYHNLINYGIFHSIKDDKEYFVTNEKNLLVIYLLRENKKIKILEGHKYDVNLIKYYIDEKNNNEYLMSKDDDRNIIIWDISKNYSIYSRQRILLYAKSYSFILFFPLHNQQNYFISSLFSQGTEDLKIYKLENQELVGTFSTPSNNSINYLLTWYNNSNNKYYIIKFLFEKIRINDLFNGELYTEFREPSKVFIPGFVQTKNNISYLYAFTSRNPLIGVWDLNNKNSIIKIPVFPCRKLIRGNLNFCLVLTDQSIDVLDLKIFRIIQSFKKKKCLDSQENNIIKLSDNNGKEFLIYVEKAYNNGIIINLLDY